ncbi:MAG: methionine gamma-lyase family protein [Clostridia bacterium]|nr:methionine gamma-lyase family protein [Clostridia bacterium]
MNYSEFLNKEYGIKAEIVSLMQKAEAELNDKFKEIEQTAEINTAKVMRAFREHKVSEQHLGITTGYGYDDIGRDTLDKIYADVFGAESALVRHSIVSGTHALSTCLFGVLRPGDVMLSVTGRPYDTLEEVIGIRGEGNGSLADWGVKYREVALKPDGTPDLDAIRANITPDVRLIEIQRSKGYDWRKSLLIEDIRKICECVKQINPNVICMVDNCYGEFAETEEPCDAGADLVVGSLIKNPGGGLALTGAYIAGRADLIEQVSYRLTSPGIGAEVGATLGMNRNMYQGFFIAPHVVAESIKTSLLAAKMLELSGYEVCPTSDEARGDIIQAVKLGSPEKLCAFCQGIQAGSPVDAFVTPMPWDMPGYENKVIMAAGTFTSGASIEISADGPIREPYVAYMQGGLTYESGKLAVMCAINNIK